MRARSFVLAIVLVLLLGACSSVERTWHSIVGGQNPLVGKIWNVREKRFISQTELLRDLSANDFVLLGEKHDNSDHHILQAEVISGIAKASKKPRVAFEQLNPDQKAKLQTYLELNPNSATGLGDALAWKQSGWPEWKLYEPVFQAALDAKMAIVPINLSAEEKKKVDSKGLEGLDDNLYRELNMHGKFSPSVVAMLTEEIRAAHCYQLPDEVVPRFLEMQHAWDAVMAKRAEEAAKQDGAILIVGAGHARNEWGIPIFLKRINKLAKVASLALVEVKKEYIKPEIYVESEAPYDYIWFTPASSNEDPCVKNQDALKKISSPAKAAEQKKSKAAPKKKQKKPSAAE